MKSTTLKNIFVLLFISILLSENTITTLQIHSNINANIEANSNNNRRRSKSKSRRTTEKSSTAIQTNSQIGPGIVFPVIWGCAVVGSIFFGGNTAEDTKKKAVLELQYQFNNRTEFLIELLAERPAIERDFKDKIMRKIATFISFFDRSFYVKRSKERQVLTAYIDCYLAEARKSIENLIDPNAPASRSIDEATKLNIKSSGIIYSNKGKQVKSVALSATIDEFVGNFIKDELPKFKNCQSRKLNELKSAYSAIFVKVNQIFADLEQPRISHAEASRKFTDMKKNEKDLYEKLAIQLEESIDTVIDYSKKAKTYSENILFVTDKMKEVIDFFENPSKGAAKQLGLSKAQMDEILREVKPLKDIAERISKFGKDNANNLQAIKGFLEKHEGKIKFIKDKAGKTLNTAQLAKDILVGYRSLSSQDSPSIAMAKVLILAANVSRIVPFKSPVKEFVENTMERAANYIQESKTLQDAIDEGITSQAQEITKCTDRGIIPPNAMSPFHEDLHPNLMDHSMSEFKPYIAVIKETFRDKANEIIADAERGNINNAAGTLEDFGTDLDTRLSARKDANKKESDSYFFSRFYDNPFCSGGDNDSSTDDSGSISRSSTRRSSTRRSSTSGSRSAASGSGSDNSGSKSASVSRQDSNKSEKAHPADRFRNSDAGLDW